MGDFFKTQLDTVLSGNWISYSLDFTADSWLIANDDDSGRDLDFSFNGGITHFTLYGDIKESVANDNRRRNKIYLRPNNSAQSGIPYRVSAWSIN